MKLSLSATDTVWDELPPQRRHELTLTVKADDLDDLDHVNNTVYLAWCEQVARLHASSLGLDTPTLRQLGAVPVVREHTIRYLKPAQQGDQVRVRTALTASEGLRSTRAYVIDRVNSEDPPAGVRLAECQTDWIWIDPSTGRPRKTPPEVRRRFGFEN